MVLLYSGLNCKAIAHLHLAGVLALRSKHSYHAQVHFRLTTNYKDMHQVSISSHEGEIDFSSSDSESDEPLEHESE